MVIADFNVKRITIFKAKTYPPLIVDRNRMLAFPITFQCMQSISRRRSQVLKFRSEVHILELSSRSLRNVCWKSLGLASLVEVFGTPISKGLDHAA